ncbi:hypothetical protein EDC01DRAFT_678694 [Geopyxis carbonaria]|nr:hypothetical protein EDC01DRAFT_678694 [Geopyxis carbonaria]
MSNNESEQPTGPYSADPSPIIRDPSGLPPNIAVTTQEYTGRSAMPDPDLRIQVPASPRASSDELKSVGSSVVANSFPPPDTQGKIQNIDGPCSSSPRNAVSGDGTSLRTPSTTECTPYRRTGIPIEPSTYPHSTTPGTDPEYALSETGDANYTRFREDKTVEDQLEALWSCLSDVKVAHEKTTLAHEKTTLALRELAELNSEITSKISSVGQTWRDNRAARYDMVQQMIDLIEDQRRRARNMQYY